MVSVHWPYLSKVGFSKQAALVTIEALPKDVQKDYESNELTSFVPQSSAPAASGALVVAQAIVLM